ncbi:hypothetical protein Q3G72_011361 [Acer saccharum]|nr:hypothetical protein Q3G72_011361 [Acer saccharum]
MNRSTRMAIVLGEGGDWCSGVYRRFRITRGGVNEHVTNENGCENKKDEIDLDPKSAIGGGVEDVYNEDRATEDQFVTPWTFSVAKSPTLIDLIGTPWMDGTYGISQCATMPGDTFTYQFVVDKRESSLYGLIKVTVPTGKSEPFVYDGGDHSIVLSDWYHSSSYEHATDLTSLPCVWIGPPQGHNMTVVEADWNYVEPFVTQNLYIYSGDTYSVLVTANQDSSSNYWMSTNVVGRKPATPPGLAIFNYNPNHFQKLPPTTPPPGPAWNDTGARINQSLAIKAHQGFIQSPPSTSDKVILLLNTQNTIQGRIGGLSLNNVSHTIPILLT